MSKKKMKKKSRWGGSRDNSGAKPRPEGTIKICVSLSEKTWQAARRSWTGKASHLVEKLVSAYVKLGEPGQHQEAKI